MAGRLPFLKVGQERSEDRTSKVLEACGAGFEGGEAKSMAQKAGLRKFEGCKPRERVRGSG